MFTIECNDFKEHRDAGPWRSYDLHTEGSTLEELLNNAVYWQIDQDGGCLGYVSADDSIAVEYITTEYTILLDNYDPTPYCKDCGAKSNKQCKCSPTAINN